jgi:hypothetical protein
MRCAVRAIIGFGLLVVLALTGVEHLTSSGYVGDHSGSALAKASITGSLTGAAPSTERTSPSIFQTLAAADGLPVVTAAPDAPRATPIEPIVAPVKKAFPQPQLQKAATPHAASGKVKVRTTVGQGSNGKAAPKTGFKLTCTSSQKLDTVKKRCVPLKGTALASSKI